MYLLGRDHGLPTFLETRRKCGLNADYKSFQDLKEIFPQSYIDLLSKEYESVEDIDLYVGGVLESLVTADQIFGATLRCIISDQLQRNAAGDAYFFTNPSSPYPFTSNQIQAIKDYDLANLICGNSNVESVAPAWYLVDDSSTNKLVKCSEYKQMNLAAWKNI